MSPATRLSSATQVIVSARVSKSGDAMPQPGDLEATSAVIAVGTHDLKVVISDVKK
jgi:cytochrome c-type biogenesis protein CcmH